MDSLPEIAVLIPAYNAEKIIMRSIKSLNTSTIEHDIIVVDDGSKIHVADRIDKQNNLTVLRLDKNSGIGAALNHGLEYILERGYKYIARIDADDTVKPERLERQKDFLDNNPDIGLVGSWVRIVNEEGVPQYYYNVPTDHDDIAVEMFYHNCIFHPAIMFRCEIVKQGVYYDPLYTSGGDWDYIRKFIKKTKIANIPEYLIDYTISMNGITQSKPASHMLKRDLRIQFSHADWSSQHFYLGVIKTAINTVRMLLKTRKRHKIQDISLPKTKTLPIYIRSPFRGMIKIGEKTID